MVTGIINSLGTEVSLIKPLHQTLIFARRVGNEEFATWVLNELNGYNNKKHDDKALPSYRYVRHIVMGVMRQNGRLTKETALPLSCFGKILQEGLSRRVFDESVATLEGMTKYSDNQYIVKVLAADFCSGLTQQARINGHNFEVISCRELTAVPEVIGIVTSIRTKLLELLLAVEAKYPSVNVLKTKGKQKSQLNTTINYYMGQIYNITSTGEGSLVNTGNNNINTVNKR